MQSFGWDRERKKQKKKYLFNYEVIGTNVLTFILARRRVQALHIGPRGKERHCRVLLPGFSPPNSSSSSNKITQGQIIGASFIVELKSENNFSPINLEQEQKKQERKK